MGFVAGYKTKKTVKEWVKFGLIYGVYCFLGYLLLIEFPIRLSSFVGDATHSATFSGYFLGLFYVMISLHHYFIDSVIWKTKDPIVVDNVLN
jgi:hypothetical protein